MFCILCQFPPLLLIHLFCCGYSLTISQIPTWILTLILPPLWHKGRETGWKNLISFPTSALLNSDFSTPSSSGTGRMGRASISPQQVLAAAAYCFSQLPHSSTDPQQAAVWIPAPTSAVPPPLHPLSFLTLQLFFTFSAPFFSLWKGLVERFFCLFLNMLSQRCQHLGCRAHLFPVMG